MILVLCHPGDVPALWLAGTMRALGTRDVELVTVEELVYSRRIVYRLSDSGSSGGIGLADGRTLRPSLDVAAGAEGLVAFTGENRGPDIRGGSQFRSCVSSS